MNLGYNKFLFILPFDHRGTFIKGMFNKEEKDLTQEIEEEVRALKKIVYEGFKRAVLKSVPKEFAAIPSSKRKAASESFCSLVPVFVS